MKRTFCSFPVHDFDKVKAQMLDWANQFSICCFLDSHQYYLQEHNYECLLAVNAECMLKASGGSALEQLQSFIDQNRDWCFGHLGYDLKNEIEDLKSENADALHFDDLCFFIPEIVLILNKYELLIGVKNMEHAALARDILGYIPDHTFPSLLHINLKSRFTRKSYIDTVRQLQRHILRGDCYEINFCQEFYNDCVTIDPLQVYKALCRESPNPFSCYYRLEDKYLLCASPERYLCKRGNRLLSQPIKGTIARNIKDIDSDRLNRELLERSSKEQSENIMVVDLVRNDLSKICTEGSVKVDDLMGIYAFPQVYQMISTISGEVTSDISLTEMIKATFPMGSMTGAPKKRVMELIEQYELTKRGLFSGSVGYITPEQNMDFNVVIRSVLYNAAEGYLSCQTGSAITHYSRAEDEYEECLLKASSIKKVLNSN